ncbi:MAG: ABC transporter substrate-binding protein [Azospirillaceae bacterium]
MTQRRPTAREVQPTMRLPLQSLIAPLAFAATLAATAAGAGAAEFRWASQTDPSSMDPHAVNAAPVHSFLNNVYEGLVRRGRDMGLEPALATSWEPLGQEGWRFHLREGVTFHGGEAFDADDVVFSYERATSEQSDVASFFASVEAVEKVDAHTVDFLTSRPDPLLPSGIANFMIMDEGWATANGAEVPARDRELHTTFNANGTGAFRLVERQPDVRTVLEPFAGWWGEAGHDISRAVFTPIGTPATAVAALISGEIDFYEPIPLQDIPRLEEAEDLTVHQGVEARVIFFGFEHAADSLRYADGTVDDNPFRDARVRRAVYHAIDARAIVRTIMRGNAQATGLLIAPSVNGYRGEMDVRLPHDPERARALLAEAGYPDGFRFGLRCPNDRYINDEPICVAVAGMLERVGLEVDLQTMPVAQYWPELREDRFDMYMLGWSPGTFDAEHPIRFLMATPDEEGRLGSWNFGEYSDTRVDDLLARIQVELDPQARQAAIDDVHRILREDAVYIPLHVQPLVWGSRASVSVSQRADNFFILRWVRIDGE